MEGLAFLASMFLVGSLAQLVDGAIGMGFGAISASLLIGLGLPPPLAIATVNTAKVATGLASGMAHFHRGNVKREWLLGLILSGAMGGALGALLLVSLLREVNLTPFIAVILLGMGVLVLRRFIPRPCTQLTALAADDPPPKPSRRLPLVGLFSGLSQGVAGVYGPFATSFLLFANNAEPREAVGTVNMAEFFVTLAASFTFIVALGWGGFRWDIALALTLGGLVTAPLAAYLCHRFPPRILGILVGVTVILLNLKTILSSLGL